jgi:hypothetical protein
MRAVGARRQAREFILEVQTLAGEIRSDPGLDGAAVVAELGGAKWVQDKGAIAAAKRACGRGPLFFFVETQATGREVQPRRVIVTAVNTRRLSRGHGYWFATCPLELQARPWRNCLVTVEISLP